MNFDSRIFSRWSHMIDNLQTICDKSSSTDSCRLEAKLRLSDIWPIGDFGLYINIRSAALEHFGFIQSITSLN